MTPLLNIRLLDARAEVGEKQMQREFRKPVMFTPRHYNKHGKNHSFRYGTSTARRRPDVSKVTATDTDKPLLHFMHTQS